MANSNRNWELQRRQRFAEENVNNSWEDVIFADITTFSVDSSGMVSQSSSPTRPSEFSIRVWAWFNFNGKAETPLEHCIRQITYMSEEEFLEVIDESFLPLATARFQSTPVTFLEDFDLSAIPHSAYEWFEDYKVDKFPPKSRDLSPFASLWSSIAWSLNQDLRLIRGNCDELWESIEMVWSSKSLCIELWKRQIDNLKEKITSIVKRQAAS